MGKVEQISSFLPLSPFRFPLFYQRAKTGFITTTIEKYNP
jgi:hypothetical protein